MVPPSIKTINTPSLHTSFNIKINVNFQLILVDNYDSHLEHRVIDHVIPHVIRKYIALITR